MVTMKENVVVSLTSYGKRLNNLPIVLDTIYYQTLLPDIVVLNLANDEAVPRAVWEYLVSHNVEVNRVPDTKVYKKIVPTLKSHPNDIIISIDDDFIYPPQMIADFMDIHKKYPNNPISGNRVIFNGFQCHCGCASLTKKEFFGNLLDEIDDELMSNCPSDDLVYTFLSLASGHAYIRTQDQYFMNLAPCGNENSYSKEIVGDTGIENTFDYLIKRFGNKTVHPSYYVQGPYMGELLDELFEANIVFVKKDVEKNIRASYAYRLGKVLLKPFSWIRSNINL